MQGILHGRASTSPHWQFSMHFCLDVPHSARDHVACGKPREQFRDVTLCFGHCTGFWLSMRSCFVCETPGLACAVLGFAHAMPCHPIPSIPGKFRGGKVKTRRPTSRPGHDASFSKLGGHRSDLGSCARWLGWAGVFRSGLDWETTASHTASLPETRPASPPPH